MTNDAIVPSCHLAHLPWKSFLKSWQQNKNRNNVFNQSLSFCVERVGGFCHTEQVLGGGDPIGQADDITSRHAISQSVLGKCDDAGAPGNKTLCLPSESQKIHKKF